MLLPSAILTGAATDLINLRQAAREMVGFDLHSVILNDKEETGRGHVTFVSCLRG